MILPFFPNDFAGTVLRRSVQRFRGTCVNKHHIVRSLPVILFLFVIGIRLLFGQQQPIDSLITGCQKGDHWDRFTVHCEPLVETSEVNGRSIKDLSAVLNRHDKELISLKGVTAVGIDEHGLFIEAQPDHDPLPDSIEGIPLWAYPASTNVGVSGTQR